MPPFAICSSPLCEYRIKLQDTKAGSPVRTPATCPECQAPMISTCPSCGFLLLGLAPGRRPKCEVCPSDIKQLFRTDQTPTNSRFVFTSGPKKVYSEMTRAHTKFDEEYPCPKSPDEIDPLCLEQACRSVLTDLSCSIEQFAEHYKVPPDILEMMIVDRQVSKQMDLQPTPTRLFVLRKEDRG